VLVGVAALARRAVALVVAPGSVILLSSLSSLQ